MKGAVLVVDDEEDIRVLARITLEHAGYDVTEAGTGTEALDAIAKAKPDGLLLDIRLPDMDGWQVIERLQTDGLIEGISVIVFSAHEADYMARKAREVGSEGFLAKPFDPEDLVHAVESAMAHKDAAAPAMDRGVPRGEAIAEVIAGHLESGEEIEIESDVLLRVAGQFLTRCRLALTDRQLILLKQAWPWGYKVSAVHQRASCSVSGHKERFDGSQLLAIQDGDEKIALYFGRRWSDNATRLREALTAAG